MSVAIDCCHRLVAQWQRGTKTMKNFHLPLPEQTYALLRAEAERMQVPATALAREAVDLWLRQQRRTARQDAIASYAAEMAGTSIDLDADLESAGIEHIVNSGRATR
jgi:hypothetical protein